MSTVAFLGYLRKLDVRLRAEDGRLRFDAPKDALTADLRAELKRRKSALLDVLRAASGDAPIEPVARDGELPLSFSQERLWFLAELEPGTPAYNLPEAVRLTGRLDTAALAASLEEMVRRHEALRTAFRAVDGRPVEVISPRAELPLPVVDLRRLPAAGREAAAGRLASEVAATGFDLTRGPLIRTLLARLGETDHVFVLNIHHIVFDRWSMGVFLTELPVVYDAFRRHRPSPLPAPRLQYVDFAAWQKRWLRGEVLESLLAYWRRQLGDAPPPLELPTDRPRPAMRTDHGAKLSAALPAALVEPLAKLAREHGVTLFMTLLAALKVLLYRYTGQRDLAVGTFIANRNRAEIEKLIGFFVNTLILRTELAGGLAFRQLLERVREVTLAAYRHQDLPLERLLEELKPERTTRTTPIFQVMLVHQITPAPALALPDLEVRRLEIDGGVWAHFDWTVWLWEGDGGWLDGFVDFNTDLFDATTIRRLLGHWRTLLAAAAARPGAPLAALPLLAPPERHQLQVGWNDTRGIRPSGGTPVHRLFEAQAARTPAAPAVIAGEEWLTYRELDQRANQLARYLRRLGVDHEVRVALVLERCPEMVVTLLAVLKAGGAYVPIDPASPRERRNRMLADAGAPLLLTHRHLAAEEPAAARVVVLDEIGDELAGQSRESPAVTVAGGNLAYVIYTSGSTGRPKGVQITHTSLAAFAEATVATYALGADDRVLQFASLSFDTSCEEIYPALICGAAVVLRTDAWLESPRSFLAACRSRKVTVLDLPTAYWHELTLTSQDWAEAENLRLVIIGGEQARADAFERWWRQVGPRVPLVNTYGPTETTVAAAKGGLTDPARDLPGLPLGRPMRDVRAHVLAHDLSPVPVSVAGELCLGGPGLARGYLDRPGRSAGSFIPDPFCHEPGERLYRTGDRVRWLVDGRLQFLGRVDQQVKVRGFRIEPGEVEAALGRHPAVRRSIVVTRDDVSDRGDTRLVAYVVCGPETAPTVSELHRFLRDALPEHMVPAAFVVLDALPLLPSGKVDPRRLPPPDRGRPELEGELRPPSSPVEDALAEIFIELTGRERVGVDDSFFELGGHSLLATQAVSRIRGVFEIELPLRTIFSTPTIAELALEIEDRLLARVEALSEQEIEALT